MLPDVSGLDVSTLESTLAGTLTTPDPIPALVIAPAVELRERGRGIRSMVHPASALVPADTIVRQYGLRAGEDMALLCVYQ